MFNRISTSTLVVMAAIMALNTAAGLNPALAQWDELAKLTASDGVADDHFGGWVAIDGDNVVIGVTKDDDNGTNSGSAYVFHFNGSAWVEQQKLLASDGAAGDTFGRRVAISGNCIMIESPFDQDCGSETGAVYAFRFNGSSWVQEQKIVASDCASEDVFGYDIAISGDTAVITTPYDNDYGSKTGSAYVFQFNGSSWVEQQKLLAWDHSSYDHFGRFAAIQGDTIVVGSAYDDDNGHNSGSVYVFHFNGSSWVQEQKLLASDGASGDHFGWSGGISGDSLVIGANWDDDSGTDSGSAYVFHFNGSSWAEQQKLLASDGAAGDKFASAGLEISGDTIAVTSVYDDDYGESTGSAYVFQFNGSSWVEEQKLLASDAAAGDHFGSVAIHGETIVIGAWAWEDDDSGTDSGSAYVFGSDGSGNQPPVADAGGRTAAWWMNTSSSMQRLATTLTGRLLDTNGISPTTEVGIRTSGSQTRQSRQATQRSSMDRQRFWCRTIAVECPPLPQTWTFTPMPTNGQLLLLRV